MEGHTISNKIVKELQLISKSRDVTLDYGNPISGADEGFFHRVQEMKCAEIGLILLRNKPRSSDIVNEIEVPSSNIQHSQSWAQCATYILSKSKL